MDSSEKKRIDSIDLLKGIAIYMVIVYHFNEIPINFLEENGFKVYFNLFLESILSIGVPTFFFVNGFLQLNKKEIDVKQHFNKVLKLIILTVIWSGLTLLSLCFIRQESLSSLQFLKNLWFLKTNWNNHLWFLGTLVVIYIFFPLIHSVYQTNKKTYYFFLAFVLLFTFGNTLIENALVTLSFLFNKFTNVDFELNYWGPFNPFRGIHAYSIGYFMLGGLSIKYVSEIKKQRKIIPIVVILLSMVFLWLYTIITSLRRGVLWDHVWNGYDMIFTLINVIALFVITLNYQSKGIPGKFIRILGKNSLGIYFLHVIIGSFLIPFFAQLKCAQTLWSNLIFAFVVLLCSLITTLGLKKVPVLKRLFEI